MAQINPRPFSDAIQLSDAIYELILTNWGNTGAAKDRDNGSLQYPPIKSITNGSIPYGVPTDSNAFLLPEIPGVSAIAISPRSDIDRAIIRYQGNQQVPPTFANIPTVPGFTLMPCTYTQGFFNKGGILETEQVVSVGAPLIGMQPGPIVVRAHPAGWFTDTVNPYGSGTAIPFGTTLGVGAASSEFPVWTNPELRLLLYFTGVAALPPGIRAPYHLAFGCSPPNGPGFTLIKVVPIMGRRHVKVAARNRAAGAVNVKLGGVVSRVLASNNVAPFGSVVSDELELVASTAIVGQAGTIFTLDHPGVTFLLLWANGAGIDAVDFSIDAFDA